jgi:hypothetical protein
VPTRDGSMYVPPPVCMGVSLDVCPVKALSVLPTFLLSEGGLGVTIRNQ